MVTIVDPTVLALLATMPEENKNLLSLPPQSDILIKWQTTDEKQAVVVSSVKLMNLESEGRRGSRGGRRSSRRNSAPSPPPVPVPLPVRPPSPSPAAAASEEEEE